MSKKRLTVERLFSEPNLSGPTPIGVKFSPDGKRITYLRPNEKDGEVLDLWAYGIATGQRTLLVRAAELMPPEKAELSEQEASRRERMRIRQRGIVEYGWAKSGTRLLFPLDGAVYVYDLDGSPDERVRCVVKAGDEPVIDPKFSPQGDAVAFVRAGNLFVAWVDREELGQLTWDGGQAVQNGVAEFVAQEEMDRYTGYWWSPDGKRIAYTQVDESPVALVQRPAYYRDRIEVIEQRYPAAGQDNALVRVGVVEVATGKTTWADTGDADDVYIPRVDWLPDSERLAVQVQSRDQKTLDLWFVDVQNGESSIILSEQDEHWVELHDDLRFLDDGERFVWSSCRSGYKHLYLYELDGRLIRPLTRGPASTQLCGIDGERGFVYWQGWNGSPLEQHLYRVSLDGGDLEQITRLPGWHHVAMAPDSLHYVDTHSDTVTPAQVHLYAIGGQQVATLEANELPERDEYDWGAVELVTIEAGDGTPLYGRLTRPPDFDPQGTYATLVMVYGGPHAQRVRKAWEASLVTQLFAQNGFLVFELDNRGMGNRGQDFAAALYLHMGTVEVEDQVAGVEYLKTLPAVDPARIGMFGWSYGGYMTLMCMMRASGVYRAGVSVAPVTDWRLYDTHYTERYMGRPQENEEGYEDSSVLAHVEDLQGDLLLVHGMADDNVLFQHSVLLMDALQQARIPFKMMAYSGKKHGISGKQTRIHLYEMVVEHLKQALGSG